MRKSLKKFAALALGAALILSACGNGTAPTPPEPLASPAVQQVVPEFPADPLTQDDEIWCSFCDMTFGDMRQSIIERGATVFEDATGMSIVFDNPDDIVSIAAPHVMARGSSNDSEIYVLFTWRHWRYDWHVDGYNFGIQWNMQPQVVRGIREGRRYIDVDTVDVRFYPVVDWGGGARSQPIHVSIPGETFVEEFIPLLHQHLGLTMMDMWFIGDSRLYVNLDGAVMYTQGSAAGYAILVSLYRTLFSLPVEEIVVLVEGQSEAMGDHIGFGPIEKRDDPMIQQWLELS